MQITPLSADNRCLPVAEFHFTIPVAVLPSGTQAKIGPLSADNRCHWMSGVPFHDTDNVVASG
ncbi:hypothetical protein, partial [Aeromonas veronii]|uniref:hypothetical protein n=1 Tax=Aeromonas veronii TaxID=654 RepID=UPI003D23AA41